MVIPFSSRAFVASVGQFARSFKIFVGRSAASVVAYASFVLTLAVFAVTEGPFAVLWPDFGPDLKLEDYEAEIKDVSDELDGYNGTVAEADDRQNKFEAKERAMRARNARFLTATEARFGPDSSEYELAGGTRQSERKKGGRKAGSGTPPPKP